MQIRNSRQMKKILRDNGLLDVVNVNGYDELEVAIFNDLGNVDREECDRVADHALELLSEYDGGWAGIRTGYGGWLLRQNCCDLGDWNDRSSRWHY